jgi:hypothetical protein
MFVPLRESQRNPDPALPRDRSKLRRLHPWRLDAESLRLLQRWGKLNVFIIRKWWGRREPNMHRLNKINTSQGMRYTAAALIDSSPIDKSH